MLVTTFLLLLIHIEKYFYRPFSVVYSLQQQKQQLQKIRRLYKEKQGQWLYVGKWSCHGKLVGWLVGQSLRQSVRPSVTEIYMVKRGDVVLDKNNRWLIMIWPVYEKWIFLFGLFYHFESFFCCWWSNKLKSQRWQTFSVWRNEVIFGNRQKYVWMDIGFKIWRRSG